MKARIEKWRDIPAIRIPTPLAEETRLTEGAIVDLSLVERKLVIVARQPREYWLPELLEGVTNANRHAEVDTGPATGRETW